LKHNRSDPLDQHRQRDQRSQIQLKRGRKAAARQLQQQMAVLQHPRSRKRRNGAVVRRALSTRNIRLPTRLILAFKAAQQRTSNPRALLPAPPGPATRKPLGARRIARTLLPLELSRLLRRMLGTPPVMHPSLKHGEKATLQSALGREGVRY
jgi:hypothetical protein